MPRTQTQNGENRLSPLTEQVMHQIVEHLGENRVEEGRHLSAQKLADAFLVSRQPVKEALKALEGYGVVVSKPNRGYFTAMPSEDLEKLNLPTLKSREEEPYFRIAEDRLAGFLPDEITETELLRHYQLTRGELQEMLLRMAREGWIEPKPGYGWRFLSILTTPEAYQMSYRFRSVIEPAAILEPTFAVDKEAFERNREQLHALLDGGIWKFSPTRLFKTGSEVHETIVRCSGNPWFLDALQRQNRLRRLIEYRALVDRGRLISQSHEHLAILDLLEAGKMGEAADLVREHLRNALERKTRFFSRNSPDGNTVVPSF